MESNDKTAGSVLRKNPSTDLCYHYFLSLVLTQV